MTANERLIILDKRLMLFELKLSIQSHVLECKYGKHHGNLFKSFCNLHAIRRLLFDAEIIRSQPIPKFKKGGKVKFVEHEVYIDIHGRQYEAHI